MLHKTKGIVLHHIKYSDTSLIVKIYTEAFGLQSYLVKGARSKKSAFRSSLFQPLSLLELVVYHREKHDLQHIREAEVAEPFHSISSDLRKSTIALFLSEILIKTINEGETNSEMFEYISSSLHFFDMQTEGVENFHFYFLIQLSRYLGFHPQGESGEKSYFDLREGRFRNVQPIHPDYLTGNTSVNFYLLSHAGAADLAGISLANNQRSDLLSAILLYYQIHLSGLGNIKSVEVLKEVFR
jgi:DNA repair protein RecO (recombination protein O)